MLLVFHIVSDGMAQLFLEDRGVGGGVDNGDDLYVWEGDHDLHVWKGGHDFHVWVGGHDLHVWKGGHDLLAWFGGIDLHVWGGGHDQLVHNAVDDGDSHVGDDGQVDPHAQARVHLKGNKKLSIIALQPEEGFLPSDFQLVKLTHRSVLLYIAVNSCTLLSSTTIFQQ